MLNLGNVTTLVGEKVTEARSFCAGNIHPLAYNVRYFILRVLGPIRCFYNSLTVFPYEDSAPPYRRDVVSSWDVRSYRKDVSCMTPMPHL